MIISHHHHVSSLCFFLIYLWFLHVSGLLPRAILQISTKLMRKRSSLALEMKMCLDHVRSAVRHYLFQSNVSCWHCALPSLLSRTFYSHIVPEPSTVRIFQGNNRVTLQFWEERVIEKIPVVEMDNLLEIQSSNIQPPPVLLTRTGHFRCSQKQLNTK